MTSRIPTDMVADRTSKAKLSDTLGSMQTSINTNTSSLAEIVQLPKDFTEAQFMSVLNNVPDGGIVKLPQGTYTVNGTFSRAFTKGITLIGDKGTVLDLTANTNLTPLTFQGAKGVSSPLTANGVQYQNTIQTNLACNAGDILLITSTDLWDSSRTYYYKGEMVEVDSVSSGTVTLRGALADNYNTSTTTVYLLTMPKIVMKDITIKRNSNQMGLYIQYAKNVFLENVEITGARERCFWLDYVYGASVNNCYASDCWYSASSTSYGIAVTSSQNVNINGGKFLGGRHGIAFGGNEPCRYNKIDGVLIGNEVQSGVYCMDNHGNTEYTTISNCTILNGLSCSGTNYTIKNNRIISSSSINLGISLLFEVGYNGKITIEDNDIVCLGSSAVGINIQAIVSNITLNKVTIRNNKVSTPYIGVMVNGKDSTITGFSINEVDIENNYVTSNTSYALYIPDRNPTYMHIDKLRITGGIFNSTSYRACYIYLDSTSDILIDAVDLISQMASDTGALIYGCRNIGIKNSHFKGISTTKYNIFRCSGNLQVINNLFENFTQNSGISYSGTPLAVQAVVRDNTFISCSGTVDKSTVPTYSYINATGTGVA